MSFREELATNQRDKAAVFVTNIIPLDASRIGDALYLPGCSVPQDRQPSCKADARHAFRSRNESTSNCLRIAEDSLWFLSRRCVLPEVPEGLQDGSVDAIFLLVENRPLPAGQKRV